MQIFFPVFQPLLAVAVGEESREKAKKFSGFRGESSRVFSGGESNRKSMFWCLKVSHGFRAAKAANFWAKIHAFAESLMRGSNQNFCANFRCKIRVA